MSPPSHSARSTQCIIGTFGRTRRLAPRRSRSCALPYSITRACLRRRGWRCSAVSRMPRLRPHLVIHLSFRSESDRRLIDLLLMATHILWRGMVESPDRGTLTYVSRARVTTLPHRPFLQLDQSAALAREISQGVSIIADGFSPSRRDN